MTPLGRKRIGTITWTRYNITIPKRSMNLFLLGASAALRTILAGIQTTNHTHIWLEKSGWTNQKMEVCGGDILLVVASIGIEISNAPDLRRQRVGSNQS